MSKRSGCGDLRMCLALGKPSAEIVHVEALSPSCRANVPCLHEPSAEILRVEALSLWRRANVP